jgi:hypothetical protein
MENINNRCFKSYNNILTASERSSEKRQQAIYTEIQKNVKQLNTANPVKKNGYKYNNNTKVNQTCDLSNGYVDFAVSYDILHDVTQGAALVYPVQVSTPKYESWCGNLYSVNYTKYNVNNIVSTDGSLNIVIDPSNLLFYNSCSPVFDSMSRPEQWTHVVDLSFQNTYFARAANNTLNKC